LVFWFFGFSRFFGFGFGSGVSDESVFLFLVLAFGLEVSDQSTASSEILLKNHFPLAAFGIHYFPQKTVFPGMIPAI